MSDIITDIVSWRIVNGIWYATDDQGEEHEFSGGGGGVGPQGPPGPQGEPGPQGPPGTGGGGVQGQIITLDKTLKMFQGGSLPGGQRAQLDYADAKVRCKAFYKPGDITIVQYMLAMTGGFIDRIPDIDVAVGGEWEWELPYGHIPGWDGYFTFAGSVYYADHPRTMTCAGMIRTEAPNICIASMRVDMHWALADPGHYGEEKGVLNRRRPFLKWTPGSWVKWTLSYPAA